MDNYLVIFILFDVFFLCRDHQWGRDSYLGLTCRCRRRGFRGRKNYAPTWKTKIRSDWGDDGRDAGSPLWMSWEGRKDCVGICFDSIYLTGHQLIEEEELLYVLVLQGRWCVEDGDTYAEDEADEVGKIFFCFLGN